MKILFVDDYFADFENGLKSLFGDGNVICQKTPDFRKIRQIIGKPEAPDVDIVLLDIMFDYDEDGNPCRAHPMGGELLKKIKEKYTIPVIILTTTAHETSAEYPEADGVKSKPLDSSDDKFYKMIFEESSKLVDLYKPDMDERLGMVIGENPKMKEIAKSVIRFAKSPYSKVILITGETGTGKESICMAIHKEAGNRLDDASYQVVHCGHIDPRDFRIKLGGFPRQPQAQASIGVLEILEGLRWRGILVIDEVDDLNPDSQNVLNRILEGQPFQQENNPARTFRPGPELRFVFTAQQDLQQMVDDKNFRPDLWGRIKANRIHLPPLRERKEIIPILFNHFVGELTKGKYFDAYLRDDVKEKLLSYDYPQNIRELRNILVDAVSQTSNSPLRPEDIRFPDEGRNREDTANDKLDEVVMEIFEGKWKGADRWQQLIDIYPKAGGRLYKIMIKCIEKLRNKRERDLQHKDMADLFGITNVTMRKWITTELEIDWKKEKRFRQ